MFCPKCKVEYEDWVKECADCSVLLVKSLPVEPDIEIVEVFESDSINEIGFVKSMLEAEGLEVFIEGCTPSFTSPGVANEIKIFVSENEYNKASEIIKDYLASLVKTPSGEFVD